ncbi:uncharacterized protein METZ01_LOCUS306641 [marine metagenome]|uniref:Uncharacterized protein n=1 Tax=marine metagenome TaxID=408172 RepID=A0A382N0Z9_9ZZZZ
MKITHLSFLPTGMSFLIDLLLPPTCGLATRRSQQVETFWPEGHGLV